eukprot:scaffold39619_cov46-Phaeocystis_antarctica.AAC.2
MGPALSPACPPGPNMPPRPPPSWPLSRPPISISNSRPRRRPRRPSRDSAGLVHTLHLGRAGGRAAESVVEHGRGQGAMRGARHRSAGTWPSTPPCCL